MEISKINLNTVSTNAKKYAQRGIEEATKFGKAAKETAISKAHEFDNFTGNKISSAINKNGINSNTVIGAGIGIAAVVLAAKCLKGIFGNIGSVKKGN